MRTAALPEQKPEEPVAKPAKAAGNGQILRAVTMRAGPKKGATPIGTIPARTTVQVFSCNQWCQIVYEGKRG